MRLDFDRQTAYALAAVNWLSRLPAGSSATAHGIASSCGLPEAVLRKVLMQLSRAGIVTGSQGKGFVLGPRGRGCSVLGILEALDGFSLSGGRCLVHEKDCPQPETCPLKEASTLIREQIRGNLERIAVSELPISKNKPLPGGVGSPEADPV